MESILLRLGVEVRQSLHHMLGLLEMASEEPLSETQSQSLIRCREAGDQLLRTANDLAELARPETIAEIAATSGGAAYSPAEAVREVAGLMQTLAERKGLSFKLTIKSGVPARIVGEKSQLHDMLHRLLDNAIRYTAAGSVHLSVACSPVAGCSPGSAGSAVLTFEISDTGAGTPHELVEDFDAGAGDPGTPGLSLRILRKRLAHWGGAISIAPNWPQGTTVHVSLPVEPAPVSREEEGLAERPPSNSPLRLRILVAEDSDDSFFVFMSYVKEEGHAVARARNGVEALEMAKRGDYDFIVMDVNMPGLDGYAATRLIREWETERGRAHVPVLLLSADDLGRQVRLGAAAGCSGYLTKPTTKGRLLAALNYYAFGPPQGAAVSEHRLRLISG